MILLAYTLSPSAGIESGLPDGGMSNQQSVGFLVVGEGALFVWMPCHAW